MERWQSPGMEYNLPSCVSPHSLTSNDQGTIGTRVKGKSELLETQTCQSQLTESFSIVRLVLAL